MFILSKILNGRINTSEPRRITLSTALSAAVAAGTPISVVAGAATVLTAATTVRATHVVCEDAPSGATSVLVLDLLPGMVFSTVLTAADSTGACKIGAEVKITAQGVQPAAVASDIRGAVVFETPESTASGAEILVTFPIA